MKQTGTLKIGTKFEMLNGPEVGTRFEIIDVDTVDSKGFPAFQFRFASGLIETCAKDIFLDMLDGKYEHCCKVLDERHGH
jgi:hypothetical protein